jgi:hypothetical protein
MFFRERENKMKVNLSVLFFIFSSLVYGGGTQGGGVGVRSLSMSSTSNSSGSSVVKTKEPKASAPRERGFSK